MEENQRAEIRSSEVNLLLPITISDIEKVATPPEV
jgi:hypothetical protein